MRFIRDFQNIPRETIKHFKEAYGRKNLTLKKNDDLSWRSIRSNEFLTEYFKNIESMKDLKYLDKDQEASSSETHELLKTLCTSESTIKGSGTFNELDPKL